MRWQTVFKVTLKTICELQAPQYRMCAASFFCWRRAWKKKAQWVRRWYGKTFFAQFASEVDNGSFNKRCPWVEFINLNFFRSVFSSRLQLKSETSAKSAFAVRKKVPKLRWYIFFVLGVLYESPQLPASPRLVNCFSGSVFRMSIVSFPTRTCRTKEIERDKVSPLKRFFKTQTTKVGSSGAALFPSFTDFEYLRVACWYPYNRRLYHGTGISSFKILSPYCEYHVLSDPQTYILVSHDPSLKEGPTSFLSPSIVWTLKYRYSNFLMWLKTQNEIYLVTECSIEQMLRR